MEKDNFIKSLKIFFNPIILLFNKMVAHIHFLDPRDNTKQRIISALVLLPIALMAIFYSKDLFLFLAISVAILMTSEWLDISKEMDDQKKWRLIGFFYIAIPVYSVIKLRNYNVEILFWMFAVIWSTDIFAFFAGKTTIVFLHRAFAMRTGGAHGRIVARYGVAVILFGALDNPLSHLCNFLHEGIAIHLALLN